LIAIAADGAISAPDALMTPIFHITMPRILRQDSGFRRYAMPPCRHRLFSAAAIFGFCFSQLSDFR